MIEPIYDIPAVAERLDICVTSAYRLVRTGALHGIRAGNLWRVPKSSLDEFLRGEGGGTGGQRKSKPAMRKAA